MALLGKFTAVVPVYKNEESIPSLLARLEHVNKDLDGQFEAVLVVDGSPDRSLDLLRELLPSAGFASRLVALSRNFGSFAAIRSGLAEGRGEWFGVLAADLQEPPELLIQFHRALSEGRADVVVGVRESRSDPFGTRLASWAFWKAYRLLVRRDMPQGGVDVFGCSREIRDRILSLGEQNSTLVGLLYWLGYRRVEVPYARQARQHGKSAWSMRRKWRYLKDSVFAFSDLPMRVLGGLGLLGMGLAFLFSCLVVVARISGWIEVPGYAATVISVVFFGGLNAFGIGILGEYLWRVFENTKGRPGYLVAKAWNFEGRRPS